MSGTYISWNMSIGPHAYRDIIPQRMAIESEYETSLVEKRWWFKRFEKKATGRTIIVFNYTRTPHGEQFEDEIPFDTREEAVAWYNYIYERIFLKKEDAKFTAPPPKSKGPNLRLV